MPENSIMQSINNTAKWLKNFVNKMNGHIARSHSEGLDDYLGGNVKVIEPSEKYQYGAILASHKTQGIVPDEIAENLEVMEKRARISNIPGELSMTRQKAKSESFKNLAKIPDIWREAARVINIRYHADAAITFAKQSGFDVKKFCETKYPDLNNIPLAELANDILNELYQKNENNIQKYHRFLKTEFLKTEHTAINDYRTLIVFDAESWSYSPFQSMSTPYLKDVESEIVNLAVKGQDSDKQFQDCCNINDIFNIREQNPGKIMLAHDTVTFKEKEYFNDVEKIGKNLIDAASEIYTHVDFSQMNIPDDKFFALRKHEFEEYEKMQNGRHPQFANIKEIPYIEEVTNFIQHLTTNLHYYLEDEKIINDDDYYLEQKPDKIHETRQHVTNNGGLVTGFGNRISIDLKSPEQVEKLGGNYNKAKWLITTHQQRRNEDIHNKFGYEMSVDIEKTFKEYKKNVDKMPKDKNGNVKFPKNWPVDQYEKITRAYCAKMSHDDHLPEMTMDTKLSFNSSNPDNALSISTIIDYRTNSYVKQEELNGNYDSCAMVKTISMPVFENPMDCKMAIMEHFQQMFPNIDMNQIVNQTIFERIDLSVSLKDAYYD